MKNHLLRTKNPNIGTRKRTAILNHEMFLNRQIKNIGLM